MTLPENPSGGERVSVQAGMAQACSGGERVSVQRAWHRLVQGAALSPRGFVCVLDCAAWRGSSNKLFLQHHTVPKITLLMGAK